MAATPRLLLRRSGLVAIALSASAACWPLTARADAASPWEPGDTIGEPTGAVAHVAITHEDLALDLRPLAGANPVHVRATYYLRNDAESVTAPLVFLADQQLPSPATFSVALDETVLSATPTMLTRLPDAWKPPKSTPSLSGESPLPYFSKPGSALAFTAVISPGAHRLAVSYDALPGQDNAPLTTTLWQIGYVLAPARQWASFGDLSVQVLLPPGWRARAAPELRRVGDSLVGQFSGLPADSLAITAAYPDDPHVLSIQAWLALHWPLLLLFLLLTAAAAAAVPRFTPARWPFILSGMMWAVPAAGNWMTTANVIPPATQYGGDGKCGCVMTGCALLPGALVVALMAGGLGALTIALSMFVAAAVWARVRRRPA